MRLRFHDSHLDFGEATRISLPLLLPHCALHVEWFPECGGQGADFVAGVGYAADFLLTSLTAIQKSAGFRVSMMKVRRRGLYDASSHQQQAAPHRPPILSSFCR